MSPGGDKPPPKAPEALRKRRKLRKEEIVVEATRLFAERGYEGTSMGDVAGSVGLRKASLFHHFESKDVLYATVLSQLVESVRAAIVGAMKAEGSSVERLAALTDALTALLGAQPHAARLLIREAMDWGPVMRHQLGPEVTALLADFVTFAKAAQREGMFRADLDPEQLVLSLVGIYFMPFLIDRAIAGTAGMSPFDPRFVEERRRAAREQIRVLVLSPASEWKASP